MKEILNLAADVKNFLGTYEDEDEGDECDECGTAIINNASVQAVACELIELLVRVISEVEWALGVSKAVCPRQGYDEDDDEDASIDSGPLLKTRVRWICINSATLRACYLPPCAGPFRAKGMCSTALECDDRSRAVFSTTWDCPRR